MDTRRKLLLSSFILNILAYFITLVLVSKGFTEAGLVARYLINNPLILFAFNFSIFLLLYFIFIYLPDRTKKEEWIVSSNYACIVFFILIFIDFFHDFIIFLQVLNK